MKYLLILLIFSGNLFSSDFIQQSQNEDGSFGVHEKEIITSAVLLSLLAHGETNTSKNYGDVIKNALIFLNSRAKGLSNDNEINFKDIYVLWALTEAYAMTGIALLEESAEILCKHVLKYCNEEMSIWIEESNYSHFNIIFSNALYSSTISELEAIEGIDAKSIMTRVIRNSKVLSTNKLYDAAVMKFIQLRWGIATRDIYSQILPNKEYSKAEFQKVSKVINRLNSDSRTRKYAYIEAGNLSLDLLILLIKKLEQSHIIELKEVAKDLREDMYLSLELDKWQEFFEKFKKPPFKMLPATLVYYFKGGETWKAWNKQFQKQFTQLQKADKFWPEDLEIPPFIKLTSKEKVLLNTAFASLNLTVYFRYLAGFKPVIQRKKVPFLEEEGLDLIE